MRRNAGESSAGNQSVASGVGRVIAVRFANVFDAIFVAHEDRQAVDQLRAIVSDEPRVGLEQLVHELPAADAVVVGCGRPRQAVHGEHFAELLGDRRFRCAMRERVGRKKYFADAFAAAAFGDGLRQHARREARLHELAIGDDSW